ncbi:ABL170Cp [Eremothecium gossypii ATCC 10895]|uniref:ABL170Cp n=1 Tax=Eremothecium gossypii (strain ATCC 10895 / CBS 109.51 / FGSC 9923 / NRRL Y-1056) TaxID=284811 RepID=Q75E40_EREGS|nr:ABL170Cp [Eremothecium gossypii ATCC 10895]AAS50601.1 ABL170Cp [Eremothecium gossypii ATCC 10895]AEY94889.1 FABL170Cp [Eremothecium gossypii FDAG1]
MITDSQLNNLAISFGLAMFASIVLYYFVCSMSGDDTENKKS